MNSKNKKMLNRGSINCIKPLISFLLTKSWQISEAQNYKWNTKRTPAYWKFHYNKQNSNPSLTVTYFGSNPTEETPKLQYDKWKSGRAQQQNDRACMPKLRLLKGLNF